MKARTLLITTILSAVTILGVDACSSHSNTTAHAAPVGYPSGVNSTDKQNIAENFIGNINYARVALASYNGDRAERHIAEARNLITRMGNPAPVAHIESGRVVYDYDTDYKYHYFPIETGSIEVKKMGHGPVWAKNDLAVTDAEVVTLTVDLSGYTADTRLDNAEADIKAGKLKAADAELAQLTDEVVTVDDTSPMPVDMARDNIVLTQNFINSGNYTGARYALKHADSALHDMQKDDIYSQHKADIAAMRRDIKHLQNELTQKNPTLMQKTDAKLSKWWSELKTWSEKE